MNARAFWWSVTRVLLLCMMALFLHSRGPSLRFLTICQTFPVSWLSSTFRFQISFFFSVIRSLTFSCASLYRGSSLCRFCFASSRCLIASSISVVIHIGVLLLTFLRPMCSYAALQMVLRAVSMRSGSSRGRFGMASSTALRNASQSPLFWSHTALFEPFSLHSTVL